MIKTPARYFLSFIFYLLFFNPFPEVKAQNPMDIFKADIDTNYIETFPNAITVRAYSKTKILHLGVEDLDKGYELNYEPNGNSSLGFGINYKWIGFGFGFKVIDNESIETYGETTYFDFQTNILTRKGFFDLYYQNYKGFYLENTTAMVRNWEDPQAYMIRPDIKVVSTGINYTHVFNPEKYSYISSFSQTEVQKKSAGSVILGATVNTYSISGDSSLIPTGLIYGDAFSGKKISALNGFSTNARFGYAHTLVAKERFFLSLSLDAGMSYVVSFFDVTGDKQRSNFGVNTNVSFKLAAGYNHNKWFAGVTSSNYYFLNKTTGAENVVRIEYGFINFVVARRFMLKKEISLPSFN